MKKMNMKGFSHEILLIAVVVVVGIAGSAYLVLSHADSCTPASGVVTPTSSPTSCPTTAPVTTTAATGSCTLALNTATPKFGQTVNAIVTVKNTGATPFAPLMVFAINTYSSTGTATNHGKATAQLASISPGASVRRTVPLTYKAALRTSSVYRGKFIVSSASPAFSCQANFSLPTTKV